MCMCAVCVDMCMCVYEWHIYVRVCVEENREKWMGRAVEAHLLTVVAVSFTLSWDTSDLGQ